MHESIHPSSQRGDRNSLPGHMCAPPVCLTLSASISKDVDRSMTGEWSNTANQSRKYKSPRVDETGMRGKTESKKKKLGCSESGTQIPWIIVRIGLLIFHHGGDGLSQFHSSPVGESGLHPVEVSPPTTTASTSGPRFVRAVEGIEDNTR